MFYISLVIFVQIKIVSIKFINYRYSGINNELGTCKLCNEGDIILDSMSGLKVTATCDNCNNHFILIK